MDVLIRNIVDEVIEWDVKENFKKKKSDKKHDHLDKLLSTIRSHGVSFEVWEKRSEDGKSSGHHDFTSILGNDKKKLLKNLPDKFIECLQHETCHEVEEIWESFHELYNIITDKNSDKLTSPDRYFEMARTWVNKFTSLRDKRIGYKRAGITPYMHAMVFHVPIFMKEFHSVKTFTGQGVEKNNDVARNVVLRKSNKQDAAADIIKLESRQWHLQSCERTKRSYVKHNAHYWDKDIIEKRRKKLSSLRKNIMKGPGSMTSV